MTKDNVNPTSLIAVATSTPGRFYGQDDFVKKFRQLSPVARRFAPRLGVSRRCLALEEDDQGYFVCEDEARLSQKHPDIAVSLGAKVLGEAITLARVPVDSVGFICCVTSTGFLVPGLSSLLMRRLNLRRDCYRVDLVGMGCIGGISGLRVVRNWANEVPNRIGVFVCCEVNSAIFDIDTRVEVGIVNSLFGDGAAAGVVRSSGASELGLRIIDFESHTKYERPDAMRFDWNDETKRWSFRTTRDVASVVGDMIRVPVEKLLLRNKLRLNEVKHWVVHTGGKSVITAVKKSLGLSDHDLRHTISVLNDYGNVSSASVLFSLKRLKEEKVVPAGDPVLMIAMGPGATVEAMLLKME